MKKKVETCALCERQNVETTSHHLIPKEEGGKDGPRADLCIPCHKNIHALYTNKELAVRLSTIDDLKNDEKVSKFIKWVKKQAPTTLVKTKRANSKPTRY